MGRSGCSEQEGQGGPADQGGVRYGDLLVSVDGRPVSAMGLSDAAETLRGQAGTRVRLDLIRDGAPFSVELVRANVTTVLGGPARR